MKEIFSQIMVRIVIIFIISAAAFGYFIYPEIQKHKEDEIVLKVVKIDKELKEAFNAAVKESGSPENWFSAFSNINQSKEKFKVFIKHLKVQKYCGFEKGCFPEVTYRLMNGRDMEAAGEINHLGGGKAILEDGTLLAFMALYPGCDHSCGYTREMLNVCSQIVVDVNGFKGPNRLGYDTFVFLLSRYGIFPAGYPDQMNNYNFAVTCKVASTDNGVGCAAWVIARGNQDYLHKEDLTLEYGRAIK